MIKFYLLELGCQMNHADAERIQAVFESMGFQRTEVEAEASLLGVVACSVRQKSIDKVYSKIHAWNERKDRQNLLTFVSGCILEADEPKFLKRFDLLFHIQDLAQVPDMIRQYGVVTPWLQNLEAPAEPSLRPLSSGAQEPAYRLQALKLALDPKSAQADPMGNFWKVPPAYNSTFEAFIPIQNGCDKFCTFCAVPYTRGREISRPSAEILEEVQRLLDAGYKTITLLGQNVNSYGLDKNGQELTFSQLLDRIGALCDASGRLVWVYFTSPHPRDMGEDVIRTIAAHPSLAKQIHLPLQSGDDKVLIRMNRAHNLDQYRHTIGLIRRHLPTATLFTDIIVGFTGETLEQFENTGLAMKDIGFQMAFIALYSPRPGAASSAWEDDVPLEEKKRRLAVLTDIFCESSLAYNQTQVGQKVPVLVEKKDRKKGHLSARTEGKILVRFPSDDESLIGQFVLVEITAAVPLAMECRLLEKLP